MALLILSQNIYLYEFVISLLLFSSVHLENLKTNTIILVFFHLIDLIIIGFLVFENSYKQKKKIDYLLLLLLASEGTTKKKR